jgi:hypothetical protein
MPRTQPVSENLLKVNYTDHRVDLYRQAAKDILASNSGDARYVVAIFGPELIGSWALAFDPFRQFANGSNVVARLTNGDKIVRTRTILTQPRRDRIETWKVTLVSEGYYNNPDGGLFNYLYSGPTTSTHSSGTDINVQQEPLYGVIRDTTRRTRPMKQTQGEFELFAPRLLSPPRSKSWMKSDSLVWRSIGNGQRSRVRAYTQARQIGPEFRCSNASVQALLPGIRNRATASVQQHVYAMLDDVLPRHRTYSLYYQAAELRETSLTLRGTLEAWRNFERIIGTDMFRQLQQTRFRHLWRNPQLLQSYGRSLGRSTGFNYDATTELAEMAGSAFLTFKFGWESTVRGIQQFLPSPARATRDINRLVDRIGMDTSFRTKRTWIEPEASFPSLTNCDFLHDETIVASTPKLSGVRRCELRLMVNLRVMFPHLDIPRLRAELFRDKLGVYPSASDIYNLIPWTWLADWFGGLGDYVSLMGTISNDPSLINYGFITYREDSETAVTADGKFTTTISRDIDGNTSTINYDTRNIHTGIFKYRYQRRYSIPSVTNIKTVWDQNLNPNQLAILGALFSTRGGSVARRDAS